MSELEKNKANVEKALLQEIINYLQKKPYVEVYQLIEKIVTASNKEE